MSKHISIYAAQKFAKEQGLRYVVVYAYDGERSHIVTYGESTEDCAQAAEGGNKIKDLLGWPKSLHAEPSRVRKLKSTLQEALGHITCLCSAIETGSPSTTNEFIENERKRGRKFLEKSNGVKL